MLLVSKDIVIYSIFATISMWDYGINMQFNLCKMLKFKCSLVQIVLLPMMVNTPTLKRNLGFTFGLEIFT